MDAFAEALRKAAKIAESLNNNGKENFSLDRKEVRLPPPGCVWADHRKRILLTICLTDVTDPVIHLGSKNLYFKAVGGSEQKLYRVDMEFFKEIDIKRSRYAVRPREVTFILEKLEEICWERLLLTSQRQPWLRVDFKNWRDEDDSDNDDNPLTEKILDDLKTFDEDDENDWEDLDDDDSYSEDSSEYYEDYDESFSDEDDSEDYGDYDDSCSDEDDSEDEDDMDLLATNMMRTPRMSDREIYEEMMKTMEDSLDDCDCDDCVLIV